MNNKAVVTPGLRKGVIEIPPSKSDAQRAILAASLADGISILHNIGFSDDERAMIGSVQVLGAAVREAGNTDLIVSGSKGFPDNAILNAGESGLGLRLLTPLCAVSEGKFELTGEGTLLKRPMHFFDKVLPKLNVSFNSNNGFLPFQVQGPMLASEVEVDGSQGSQYISGLMMALPLVEGTTRLIVRNPTSVPYLQMTLNTLNKFGIEIQHQDYTDFIIAGGQKYLSTEYTIEGDWSSASFWLVAAALGCEITIQGLSMSSVQADKRILDALISAGCSILHTSDGISIDGSTKKPFHFDATHSPDLFPALVTLAMFIKGNSRITGVHRLFTKESNRAAALFHEFSKLGGRLEVIEDDLHIYGDATLIGGEVDAHHDHRMAMSLAIAGMYCDQAVHISGASSVSKSYPLFWDHLNSLMVEA